MQEIVDLSALGHILKGMDGIFEFPSSFFMFRSNFVFSYYFPSRGVLFTRSHRMLAMRLFRL